MTLFPLVPQAVEGIRPAFTGSGRIMIISQIFALFRPAVKSPADYSFEYAAYIYSLVTRVICRVSVDGSSLSGMREKVVDMPLGRMSLLVLMFPWPCERPPGFCPAGTALQDSGDSLIQPRRRGHGDSSDMGQRQLNWATAARTGVTLRLKHDPPR